MEKLLGGVETTAAAAYDNGQGDMLSMNMIPVRHEAIEQPADAGAGGGVF